MRHISDSTYNRIFYINKYSMWFLVAEIILNSQIFLCINIYHVLKSTHPWTFKLFTSFKLSQVSILNEFVWHAISFFLDIYEGVGLLGSKVTLRYLLPLLRDCQSLSKEKKFYHWELNFKIVVISFCSWKDPEI